MYGAVLKLPMRADKETIGFVDDVAFKLWHSTLKNLQNWGSSDN